MRRKLGTRYTENALFLQFLCETKIISEYKFLKRNVNNILSLKGK